MYHCSTRSSSKLSTDEPLTTICVSHEHQGATSGGTAIDAVLFTAQTLSTLQKTQARANIDAAAAISAVPTGGTLGQVLAKSSASDYAFTWITPSTGGGSGMDAITFSAQTGQPTVGTTYAALRWNNGAYPASAYQLITVGGNTCGARVLTAGNYLISANTVHGIGTSASVWLRLIYFPTGTTPAASYSGASAGDPTNLYAAGAIAIGDSQSTTSASGLTTSACAIISLPTNAQVMCYMYYGNARPITSGSFGVVRLA